MTRENAALLVESMAQENGYEPVSRAEGYFRDGRSLVYEVLNDGSYSVVLTTDADCAFTAFSTGEMVEAGASAFREDIPNVLFSMYAKPADMILAEEARQVLSAAPVLARLQWTERRPSFRGPTRAVLANNQFVIEATLDEARLDCLLSSRRSSAGTAEIGPPMSVSAYAATEKSRWSPPSNDEDKFREQVRTLVRFVSENWHSLVRLVAA